MRTIIFPAAWILILPAACLGGVGFEMAGVRMTVDGYLRADVVTFKNTVDLDSSRNDDAAAYLGLDYSIGLLGQFKENDARFYLKLERNGPTDYDAPLFAHRPIETSGGVIEEYRNDELLPGLEEFWLDLGAGGSRRLKAGLYTYEVGNGLSLNGAYENYGVALSSEKEGFSWRLYYCRPDAAYKNHLGPRIRQDEEQGVRYNHNAANFFAVDAAWTRAGQCVRPYLGVLSDYTAPEKRDNIFTLPVKRDILGTVGVAYHAERGRLSLSAEAARNFGSATSANPDYEDVIHAGYLVFADVEYRAGCVVPSLQFLLCSGNKASLEDAQNQATTLSGGKNMAFSSYSAMNQNLSDSIGAANADARPVVLMGAGYGLNNGVPRPGTYASADFDNIVMPSAGIDISIGRKTKLGVYYYYALAYARPVGTQGGEARYLARELGHEVDLCLDYRLSERVMITLLGGYFFPGKFYTELRDDTAGSILSPFVRGDGRADSACQLELAVEFSF